MTDPAPSSALRELRAQLSQPAAWLLFGCAAGLLTLVAPFNTDHLMRPVPRAVYWFGMAVLTYSTGALVTDAVSARLSGSGPGTRTLVMAAAAGLALPPVVIVYNWAVFGRPGLGALWPDALTIAGIAVIVTLAFAILGANRSVDQTEAAPSAPVLLDRLPVDKRGTLVAISVEDHYVRIRTERGEEMVLMRLGDAIRESAPVAGLQVHRSHWVARDQVTAARREGDRAILTMAHGPDIPASRRYVPALREAGLLPG